MLLIGKKKNCNMETIDWEMPTTHIKKIKILN